MNKKPRRSRITEELHPIVAQMNSGFDAHCTCHVERMKSKAEEWQERTHVPVDWLAIMIRQTLAQADQLNLQQDTLTQLEASLKLCDNQT